MAIALTEGFSGNVSPISLDVPAHSVGSSAIAAMPIPVSILGPVPPGATSLNGFAIMTIALVGLLSIPVQVQKMNFSKQWPKLALEVVVLLFLLFVGIAIVAKERAQ